jgi:hypothetical protein
MRKPVTRLDEIQALGSSMATHRAEYEEHDYTSSLLKRIARSQKERI